MRDAMDNSLLKAATKVVLEQYPRGSYDAYIMGHVMHLCKWGCFPLHYEKTGTLSLFITIDPTLCGEHLKKSKEFCATLLRRIADQLEALGQPVTQLVLYV